MHFYKNIITLSHYSKYKIMLINKQAIP